MNASDLLLCCWPGLPKLWLRGSFASLFWAVLFAMTLNLALIGTFLWTDWGTTVSPTFLWPMVVVFWFVGAVTGFQQLPTLLLIPEDVQPSQGEPDLLADAQTEYLRGHYEEAELIIKRQLVRHPDDVPAGLLLGTLLRHRGALTMARRQLSSLSKWDSSLRWRFEIDRELDLIEDMLAEVEEELGSQDSNDSTLDDSSQDGKRDDGNPSVQSAPAA